MDPEQRPPRYRCTACGNLTRFEVTQTTTTRALHHYTVGGELNVEEPEVLSLVLESVICRWCGTGADVTELEGADLAAVDRNAEPDPRTEPDRNTEPDRKTEPETVPGNSSGAS